MCFTYGNNTANKKGWARREKDLTSAPPHCVPLIPPGRALVGLGQLCPFIMVMGPACSTQRSHAVPARFILPTPGFSWLFLCFPSKLAQIRGMLSSLGVRSMEMSSSSPCGGRVEGSMEPEPPLSCRALGSVPRLWPGWMGAPGCKRAGLGVCGYCYHCCQGWAGCSQAP